jgi:hypothetical protein
VITWLAMWGMAYLEWVDIVVLRCRWRWFCQAIQVPAWHFAQLRLELQGE